MGEFCTSCGSTWVSVGIGLTTHGIDDTMALFLTDTGQSGTSCVDVTATQLGISDNLGASWSLGTTPLYWNGTNTADQDSDCMYFAYAVVSGGSGQSMTISVTPTGLTTSEATMLVVDVTGADPTGPLDGTPLQYQGVGTGSYPGGTFQTSEANDLGLGFIASSYPGSIGTGSGFTKGVGEEVATIGESESQLDYKSLGSAGSTSFSPSESPAAPWGLIVVPLLPTPALAQAPTPTTPNSVLDAGGGQTAATDTLPTPLGGDPAVGYTWLVSFDGGGATAASPSQCTIPSGTAAAGVEYSCVPPTAAAAGTYVYSMELTDSESPSAQTISGSSSSVTVNTALQAPATPTVSATALDTDQALDVQTSLPSTGTPDYGWLWLVSENGGALVSAISVCPSTYNGGGGTASEVEPCDAEATWLDPGQTYAFALQVSDSAGETVTSPTSSVVATYSPLQLTQTPAVSATLLDRNQPLTVTENLPTTGAPTYSWTWQISVDSGPYQSTSGICAISQGSSGTAGQQVTCSISANVFPAGGHYSFDVEATDSASSPESATSPGSSTVDTASTLAAPSTPTASATSLDVDQSLTLTDDLPTSGTPTYSWSWWYEVNGGAATSASGLCTSYQGSSGTAGEQVTCAVPGNTLVVGDSYQFSLLATDSASSPESQPSPYSTAVAVASQLAVTTPTVSATAVDANQAMSVGDTLPSSGTPGYGWLWLVSVNGNSYTSAALYCAVNNGAPGSGAVGQPVTCAIAAGSLGSGNTYAFELQATDSASSPETAGSSPSGTITVASAVSVPSAPTIVNGEIDQGQGVAAARATLPATLGGTSPLSYSWWFAFNGGGYALATSAVCVVPSGTASASLVVTCSSGATIAPGSYTFEVVLTDSASVPESQSSSPSGTLTVEAPLVAAAIVPASPVLDLGQSLLLTAGPSGGTLTYSVQWYGGAACTAAITGATQTTYVLAPGSTGSWPVSYEVTDTASIPDTACSPTDTATVDPGLLAGGIAPSGPSIDLGQSVALAVAASGGTTPYSYQWYASTTGTGTCPSGTLITGAVGTTFQADPTATTYYCYSLWDASVGSPTAQANSSWDLVTVDPALSAGSITPNAPTIDDGQAVVLAAAPEGGTLPYSYQWSTGVTCSAPISGATSSTYSAAPSATTLYSVEVTDSAYASTTACTQAWVTVDPALVAGPVRASLTVLDEGNEETLLTQPSGGTAPYASYQWYTGASCATPIEGATEGVYSETATANTTFSYEVTDSAYAPESACSAAFLLTINPDPQVHTFTVSASPITLGGSSSFHVGAWGGTGALTYAYAGLPPGCTSSSTDVLSCTPTAAGSFEVRVYANDSIGVSSNATTTLEVEPGTPTLLSVALLPESVGLSTGASEVFTATLTCSGGTCPSGATLSWTQSPSLGSFSTASGASTTFTAGQQSGTLVITVTAYLNGVFRSANASVAITASPSHPTSTGFLGFPGNEGYAVVGGLLVAILLVVLVAFLFMRRRGRATSSGRGSEEPVPSHEEETEPEAGASAVEGRETAPKELSAEEETPSQGGSEEEEATPQGSEGTGSPVSDASE